MNQPTETQTQSVLPPVQSAPSAGGSGTAPQGPGDNPPNAGDLSQKKSQAWIWILGGCAGVVVLGIIAMIALGWWGARKAKRELEKIQPGLEQMKANADKWNQEAEEWEKKSREFRENFPNPEEMQDQFPLPENIPESIPGKP